MPARPPWKRVAKSALKGAIAVAVLAAVGRHVARTWADLAAKGDEIRVDAPWLVAGGLLYLIGLAACGAFYGAILDASPTPIPRLAAIRAYLISHLGKYVPGKAMVVVMRVGLSTPFGARAATATFATFYETLVMMLSGAIVAAAGLAAGPRPVPSVPLLLSGGLAAAFLAVVEPRLFPRIAGLLSAPFKSIGPDSSPRFSHALLGEGLAWTLVGWLLLGLSQVAVVRAFSAEAIPLTVWPLVIGCVALATVAGFVVAVTPGGIGIREWVLLTALGPALGQDRAVIAALGLRLTWVVAEAIAAAGLALWRPSVPAAAAPESPPGPHLDVDPAPAHVHATERPRP